MEVVHGAEHESALVEVQASVEFCPLNIVAGVAVKDTVGLFKGHFSEDRTVEAFDATESPAVFEAMTV